MGMSVAGIVFEGYFFAFHLLNIVNNNQLLRGVIQAVTQNGLYNYNTTANNINTNNNNKISPYRRLDSSVVTVPLPLPFLCF